MKKIDKEITHVEHKTVYQAWDGEEFNTAEECDKYEQSAASVVMARLEDCLIAKNYDNEIFDCGDDNQYKTVVPKTKEDIDNINQLYFMFAGKCREKPLFSYDEIGTPIIIGYRITCNGYDWVWFYKLNNVIKEVTNGEYKLVESKETEDK